MLTREVGAELSRSGETTGASAHERSYVMVEGQGISNRVAQQQRLSRLFQSSLVARLKGRVKEFRIVFIQRDRRRNREIAEHSSAVLTSVRNKMDLSIGIALGSESSNCALCRAVLIFFLLRTSPVVR